MNHRLHRLYRFFSQIASQTSAMFLKRLLAICEFRGRKNLDGLRLLGGDIKTQMFNQ